MILSKSLMGNCFQTKEEINRDKMTEGSSSVVSVYKQRTNDTPLKKDISGCGLRLTTKISTQVNYQMTTTHKKCFKQPKTGNSQINYQQQFFD